MLVFWVDAKPDLIAKTFGTALKSFRPNVPAHRFAAWEDLGEAPEIGSDDVMLVCGDRPLKTLVAAGKAPKNRTVDSLREKPLQAMGGRALVTYSPSIIGIMPEKQQTIDWDVRLAERLMRTGQMMPPLGDYQWATTLQPVIDWVESRHAQTGKPVDVSTDLETEGFYPWYPDKDIVSISFTAQPETAHVLYVGKQKGPVQLIANGLFEQIEWLLTSPKVKLRLANGKFDLIWIREKWGIECTNFRFDSMLVGSLLDENRSNSLNMHAKIKSSIGGYDDPFNHEFDKDKMGEIPVADPVVGDKFLTYAGGDTDACQRVSDVFRDELVDDPELARFYVTILHPAARAFEKIERRGVHIDRQKFEVLRDDLVKTIDQSYKTALELLPNKMRIKYRDRIDDQLADGKSPMLPSILKDYFFSPAGLDLKPLVRSEKTQQPSMAKSHLKMFGDVPEAKAMVAALTDGDQAYKTKSTFVDGFLAHQRPDGLLHPTYFLAHAEYDSNDGDDSGTVSGRLSAKGPPYQIIPKKTKWAKRIRACYDAPKGKKILALDYSQGELRVISCIADEKNMIAAYQAGMDMHAVTGAKLGGVGYDEFLSWKDHSDASLAFKYAEFRDRAKPANFGLLYGMSAEGFMNYAWAAYGLKLTLKEAEEIRDLFLETYPGLPVYHEAQKKFVYAHEHVRSPLGRVRHLPTVRSWENKTRSYAVRQAINSPTQATLTDMMIWSLALIDAEYGDDIPVIGVVHDQMIAYVDEDKAELRAKQASEIMSNLPFEKLGWCPVLSFPADAEAGYDMASLGKVKIAA